MQEAKKRTIAVPIEQPTETSSRKEAQNPAEQPTGVASNFGSSSVEQPTETSSRKVAQKPAKNMICNLIFL